ncbi:hypothetical protein ECFRIK2001_0119, partial [Escherichia coli FRIK2001]
MEQEA